MNSKWEQMLSHRGILGAAGLAGWEPNGTGWRYPVYDRDGQHIAVDDETHVWRWKAFDSAAKPKYAWIPSGLGEKKPTYYLLPGTLQAIAEAHGMVILASGEPDVLAFKSAGTDNVLCWFGEGATPANLAIDLMNMNVRAIECYPDLDPTGVNWATNIVTALAGSGIECRVYRLPGADDSKMDINRLWQDCGFDRDKFWQALIACPPLSVTPRPKPQAVARTASLTSDYDDMPDDYYRAIEQALEITKYKADGWSEPVKCPLHTDTNPSAGWHKDMKILHCFVCHGEKEHALSKDVAEKLGIDYRQFLPTPAPKKVEQAPPREKAAGQPQILMSWQQAGDSFLAQLDGNVPIFEPLLCPFRNIARMGGFAKRMPPGKIMGIIGDSGMGKTSLIETYIDFHRIRGFNGVIWGPEWTYDQYFQRAIQRAGGPSFERIEDHKAWMAEDKRGVPEQARTGSRFSPYELDQVRQRTAVLQKAPGSLYFVEKAGLDITGVVKNMNDAAAQYIADGKRLAFAVLDYAQLVNAYGDSETSRLNTVLNAFKAMCIDRNIVGIVGSQMTKSDGRAAAGGSKGNQHSMVNARSDYFNLVLAITRPVDESGVAAQNANCRIVKNNLGRLGDVPLFLNAERLSWHDAETANITNY